MKPIVRRSLAAVGAGAAVAGFVGFVVQDSNHFANEVKAKHTAYATGLRANADLICRLGTSSSAGDSRILDAKILDLQRSAGVDNYGSRVTNPPDIFVCSNGVKLRIIAEDTPTTDTYRAG